MNNEAKEKAAFTGCFFFCPHGDPPQAFSFLFDYLDTLAYSRAGIGFPPLVYKRAAVFQTPSVFDMDAYIA